MIRHTKQKTEYQCIHLIFNIILMSKLKFCLELSRIPQIQDAQNGLTYISRLDCRDAMLSFKR